MVDSPKANITSRSARKSKRALILTILLIVAIIGSGFGLWKGVLEDRLIPKRWGVVEEGKIYRSGQLSAALVKKTLAKYNIAVIVNLTVENFDDKDQEAEKQAAEELGIDVFRFPLKGNGTGDIKNYAGAIAAIVDARKNGKPVLVHCAAGAQRTGGVIACYRMLVEKKPPSLAYAELLRYGWHDEPDQVLITYINTNMPELARLLEEMDVVDQMPDTLPVIRSRYQGINSSRNTNVSYAQSGPFVATIGYKKEELNFYTTAL
jgi:protein-tyrosine phosphatase